MVATVEAMAEVSVEATEVEKVKAVELSAAVAVTQEEA